MISQNFQDEVWNKLNSIERRLSLAGGGGAYAPSDAEFVVMSLTALLPNERVLTAGVGLDLVDGGAGGAATLNVDVGIIDDDIVQIDMVGVADNDYAKFTANGLEGRSYAEVLSDLSAQALAAFDWNDQDLTSIGATELYGDIKTDRWIFSDMNTFIGVNVCGAGNLAHAGGADGWFNVAIGNGALRDITTGARNVAIGYLALGNNETGFNNMAVGDAAMINNTEGHDNLAIGYRTLYTLSTGDNNVAIGSRALNLITTPGHNTAIGQRAMETVTTGANNIAIGSYSGRYQKDGIAALQTPENSVYIGYRSKSGSDPAGGEDVIDNEIVIGYNAIGNKSNTITLGNASLIGLYTDAFIYLSTIKSGANQAGAGAAADEIWKTSGHATLPDNVLMIGV